VSTHHEQQLEHFWKSIAGDWHDLVQEIVHHLHGGGKKVKSITVTIEGKTMNTVLKVGQTAQATAHGWSGPGGTGSELKLAGPVTFVSADPSVCTVDPTSGLITAVGPSVLDPGGLPIPVDITATDAATGLSNPKGDATITDTAIAAQSITVTVAAL